MDSVDVFNRLFRSTLLGTVSKEWQSKVEHDPELANGDYPKKLARIVAVALVRCCQLIESNSVPEAMVSTQDLTKTNADYEKLENHFEDLQFKFRRANEANAHIPSPVDELRRIIPMLPPYEKPPIFPIDEQLIVRDWGTYAFQNFYNEGKKVMKGFNRRFVRVIEKSGLQNRNRSYFKSKS